MERKNLEIWKPIPGYEFHEASNNGRLRSKYNKKYRILSTKKTVNNSGYIFRPLTNKGKTEADHRIIWTAFNGKIPKGMNINHKNGIKTDNRIVNLEILSIRENIIHAIKTGLTKKANSGRNLFTDEEIRTIRFFYFPKKGPLATNSILANIFDCDRHSISAIAKRKTYSWVE